MSRRLVSPSHAASACAAVQGTEPQLQQSQRLMQVGCMAASIAHDMNNLLMVVEGSASLAAEELPDTHVAQKDLTTIFQASRRASALVRQILHFIREQPPLPFPLHLGEVLTGIDLLIERVVGRNITLTCDIAPNLWLTMAAPGQLEQVLINLLTNARDASPCGGRVTILARNHTDEGGRAYVLMEVADTGVGIPAEIAQSLFEPFYTTKAPAGGSGLGLAICASIVAQLGGRIELESTVGRGTTVRVLLPKAVV